MQSIPELNETYGLPETLAFDEPHPGMPRACITTPACTGELYLQGAHLTAWQPAGEQPALYLSPHSHFVPGKAIRGGIPVVFPWFGSPDTSPIHTAPGAPSHGFARVSPWTLRFAALAGEDLHLSLTLDQTEAMRAAGFAGFELACEVILGRALTVRLLVANTGEVPFLFEEALHAYLRVSDSRAVTVEGLQNTEYLDKTEGFARKTQTEPLLRFEGETDRPYLHTAAPLLLREPVWGRGLRVTKGGSQSTVAWNPGAKLAGTLPDLGGDQWPSFVCLETGNVSEDAVTLRPREVHTMEMRLAVEAL